MEDINKRYDKSDLDETIKWLDQQYAIKEEAATRIISDQKKLDGFLLDLKIKHLQSEIEILKGNLADKAVITEKEIELNNLLRQQTERNNENILSTTQDRMDAWAIIMQKMYEQQLSEAEKQKAILDDLAEATKLLSDDITETLINNSKKREEQLDKEIEASVNRQEELRALAEKGVLEADQSLAAEQRKQAELERRKLEEQKRQERIELANTALQTYAGKVQNGDKQPLTSTIRDITTLLSFINTLPAFLEGTEDTGGPGNVDRNGGKISILHPHERVMTKEQNRELAGASNEEVVKVYSQAVKGFHSESVGNVKAATAVVMPNGNRDIVKKLDSLEKTIENKPVQIIEADQFTHAIIESFKTGNKTLSTHFKKPNING